MNDNQTPLDVAIATVTKAISELAIPGEETNSDACITIATAFIKATVNTSTQLERIANAIVAQTKMMAAVYSMNVDTPETTAKRIEEAVAPIRETEA